MASNSPGLRQRSISPGGSSRDSPAPSRRISRRSPDEGVRTKDKNYRRYASSIERALAAFDTPRLEWPDYISFLGRLLKAIQGRPSTIDSLPYKTTVADRLAQCLSSSLPSGVHQKSLEVYSHVFKLIGKDAIAHDLPVYLPGLVPVLSFASLSIRPLFLDLVETYILALDSLALRPAIKALILGLLPGLEDETSEDFGRSITILDGIRKASNENDRSPEIQNQGLGDEYFWQSLFLASISSSSRRPGALAYLTRRLPNLAPRKISTSLPNGSENAPDGLGHVAESVISPEPGLLIRCFASGLSDQQLLLQRGFLDLLLSHLPLNSPVLTERVDPDDLQTLVTAATGVVARRDMSLNRRLWSWFLGPSMPDEGDSKTSNGLLSSPVPPHTSEVSTHSITFFNRYGLEPLTKSILAMFGEMKSNTAEQARPYRICSSLMDRWEIGGLLIPRVFLSAMKYLLEYLHIASTAQFQDVLRSASSFFDGIESGIIWGQVKDLVVSALGHASLTEEVRRSKIELIQFIISHFYVREEEMVTFHMPLINVEILVLACQSEAPGRNASLTCDQNTVTASLTVAEQLSSLMPEREHLNASFGTESTIELSEHGDETERNLLRSIDSFYDSHGGNLAWSPPPFSSQAVADLLLRYSARGLVQNLIRDRGSERTEISARTMTNLLQKIPDCNSLDSRDLLSSFRQVLDKKETHNTETDFARAVSVHQVLSKLIAKRGLNVACSTLLDDVLIKLIERFWFYLHPAYPKYHVEAVRYLWQIDEINNESRILESSVSRNLALSSQGMQDDSVRVESAMRFAILWTFSILTSSMIVKSCNVWSRRSSITFSNHSPLDRPSSPSLLRPLLLWLDGLDSEDLELRNFLQGWLSDYSGVGVIIELITSQLQDLEQDRGHLLETDMECHSNNRQSNQSSERLYYLQLLMKTLSLSSEKIEISLLTHKSSRPNKEGATNTEDPLQIDIARLCLRLVRENRPWNDHIDGRQRQKQQQASIQRSSLAILQLLLSTPDPSMLQSLAMDEDLVGILESSLEGNFQETSIIKLLLDTTRGYLRLRYLQPIPESPTPHRRSTSIEAIKSLSGRQMDNPVKFAPIQNASNLSHPPKKLFRCLQSGITSSVSVHVLAEWIQFLIDVLPLYPSDVFQNLIPLVETLCKQIKLNFDGLKSLFASSEAGGWRASDQALLSLLTGLEYVLLSAHDRLIVEESDTTTAKPPEAPSHGFFGNIASGVFSTEDTKGRNATANSRLTVVLGLRDAVSLVFSVWTWASYAQDSPDFDSSSSASFAQVSSRIRSSAKQLLDQFFGAELLEALETLILSWKQHNNHSSDLASSPSHVIDLLHILDGSSPKHTIPALFNALYSRTNPSVLEGKQKSSLISDISDLDIAEFLIQYAQSLDDDSMDEIWGDCMTFLRDVLSNPISQSQVLPALLLFLLTLAEKVENTNFGEQRKMRKELIDLFLRLLTAMFTSKPSATLQEAAHVSWQSARLNVEDGPSGAKYLPSRNASVVDILSEIVNRFSVILTENDKLVGASTMILNSAISPFIHAKSFPENIGLAWFTLIQRLMKIPQASKTWRKEATDIINHPRIFSCSLDLVKEGLVPVVRQWALNEKDKISETLGRITQPTSAGIMFGVGASVARIEADKKTQLSLRRMALLVLALENDSIATQLSAVQEKVVELLTASPASSPSSATRAEVFMVLQALVIKTSSIHLAPLWPLIISELQKCLGSALPRVKDYDTYNTPSLLQACKLLDILLLMGPDDFHMHEWLFVTDSIDAVYRPNQWGAVGLVDEIAEDISSGAPTRSPHTQQSVFIDARSIISSSRKSLLLKAKGQAAEMSKDECVRNVLGPFFTQLSIHNFEATYSLADPDVEGCMDALLSDLFDDRTIIG